jgi:hypothetical protein
MTPKSRLMYLFSSRRDVLRVLGTLAGAIVTMVVLTVSLGVVPGGPSIDLIPDPAAGLPF